MEDHHPRPSIWCLGIRDRNVPCREQQEETLMTEAAIERLQAVHAIIDGGFGQLGREEALRELLQRTCTVLSADAAVIFLREERGKDFFALSSRALPTEGGLVLSSDDAVVRQLAGRAQPILLEPAQAPALAAFLPQKTQSLMAAPLVTDGSFTGMVLAGSRSLRF